MTFLPIYYLKKIDSVWPGGERPMSKRKSMGLMIHLLFHFIFYFYFYFICKLGNTLHKLFFSWKGDGNFMKWKIGRQASIKWVYIYFLESRQSKKKDPRSLLLYHNKNEKEINNPPFSPLASYSLTLLFFLSFCCCC